MIHAFLERFHHGYYRLCWHRSHRLNLACWRFQTYDQQCGKHNDACFNGCEKERSRA